MHLTESQQRTQKQLLTGSDDGQPCPWRECLNNVNRSCPYPTRSLKECEALEHADAERREKEHRKVCEQFDKALKSIPANKFKIELTENYDALNTQLKKEQRNGDHRSTESEQA